jgi:PKD repeat protein
MRKHIRSFLTGMLVFASIIAYSQGPALFSSATSYCEGSPGVTFGVNNSIMGNTYTLQKGPPWTNLSTVTGTGGPITFPGTHQAGTYRLSQFPTQTIVITEIPLPENVYIVTGGGDYCSNTEDIPSVGLDGSQVGIQYALYHNGDPLGTPQPGSGWPLNFGPQPLAGVYTIKAFRDDCERPMQGSAIVNVYDPPVVSFTYTEGGIPDACGLVNFDVTVNGVLNPTTGYSYEWDFGDELGTSNIPNPTYNFPAYGTGTEDFVVELKVTDNNICETLIAETVTVNQRPHAHLTPSNNIWTLCDNDPLAQLLLTVHNTSITTATNTGYLIDWGDGSDPVYLTPAEFPFEGSIQHLYTEKGTFPLSLTVYGPTCNDTRVYPVFNGSTPAGGVTYQAGILEGCEPHTITFRLSGEAASNAPTTLYCFNFGDGTDTCFTQEDLPPLPPEGYYSIPHTYEYHSCAEPDYAYQLTSFIQNPCSTIPNDVGGIKISKAADADFLRGEFPFDPIYVCVGVPKEFTSNTSEGCIIYGGEVIDITNYYWDFYNDSIIDSEEENPFFTFPEPGTYEVRLSALTGPGIPNCGEDDMIREVCVQDVPLPSFILTQDTFCVNEIFTPENTSITEPECADPQYLWIVSPSTGYNFTGGTNATNFEPNFRFTQAGDYTITLRIRSYSGEEYCFEEFSEPFPISIISVPDVNILGELEQCGPGVIEITTDLITYDEGNGIINGYNWTINPDDGTAFDDPNLDYPTLTITDNITRTYELTVQIDNECGIITSEPIILHVTQTIEDNVIYYDSVLELCSGMSLNQNITGSIPPALTGGDGDFEYEWYYKEGETDLWTLIEGADAADLAYDDLFDLTVDPTKFKRLVYSGSCISESNEIVFSVSPGIENNIISADQFICTGDFPLALIGEVPLEGGGGYGYLWHYSIYPFDDWPPAPGINTELNYEPPQLFQTTRYRRFVQSVACDSESNEVEITVYGNIEDNTIAIDPVFEEICAGESPGEINGSIPQQIENTSFNYQWQYSIDGVNFFDIDGANGIDYTPAELDETTWFKRIVTANDPVPAGCKISESDVVQIVVYPNPIADADAESLTISYETWTTLYGNASSGTPPYNDWSWTGPVLNPDSQNTLTAPLTETTTFCLTVTDSKGCEHTDCITIIVLGGPLQANPYPDTAICLGQSVTINAGASGGNETWEYEWISVPPGGPYPPEAQITVSPPETTIYTVTVFDGFNYASGSVEVIVDPIPTVTSANADIICSGVDLDYNITSTVTGATFTWVVIDNSDGCITGFSDSDNPETQINQELVNTCSEPKTIQYIITPTGPEPTDCLGDQFALTVTVRPAFDDTYEDQYIPPITSTTLTGLIVGGTPPYPIYNWQPHEMISGPNNIPNPITELLYNDQEYTLTVTDNAGCQYVTTVIVYITGDGLTVTCTSSVDDIICEGDSVTLIADAQGGGGGGIPENYTYDWTGLPGGATYIHPWEVNFVPAFIGENDYCVEVGDGFTFTSCSYTITVNQNPTITSPAVHEMCHNTHVNYTPTSDVAGATFQWTSSDNPCISGNGSGSGAINNLLNNTCDTPQLLIYTITPTGPSPTYCLGESFELVVWVNPNSNVINTPGSQTVVSGQYSVPVTFSSDVEGVGYNWTSTVTCPEEISYTYVNGSGPVIPSQLIAINPDGPMSCDIIYTVYPIVSGSFAPDLQCPGNSFTYTIHVNMAPSVFTVAADTVICQGESANIRLDGSETGVQYHLLRNGNAIDGSGINGDNSPLVWTGITQAGIYTVRATNMSNGAQIMMNGSAELIVRPLPLAYTLYSMQPGDSCLPVTPWLNGSQNGVMYHLHRTDFSGVFHPDLEIHVGDGLQIIYGIQIEPGYYTVEAFWDQEDVICSQLMSGVITAHPLPLEFQITPIGIVCEDVEEVCINGSEDGVIYQLWLDENPIGEPVTGTGDTICFGVLSSPGTYSIHAKNPLTLCEWFFDSTIMVNPSPNIYTLSPVNGCPGIEIILNGCQPGIHYYLFFDPLDGGKEFIQIGDFFECEDGIVNFGVHYNEGVYHVKAVNPNTTCSAWMYNTTTIWPAPQIYDMKPVGSGCQPVIFGMDNFQPGVTYYLYLNEEVVAVDDGSNGEIDFGEHTLEGLYTVKAKIEHPDGLVCWSDMNGSYLIEPQAALYTLMPENPVCSPFAFFLNGSESGVTYELHNDQSGYQQEKSGTGGIIYFDDPPSIQAGQYWVMAKKGDCPPRQMNGIRTMLPLPTLYEIVPTGLLCTYDSVAIELSDSDIGVTYELLRIPSPVPVTIVAGTGSEILFGIHTITGTYKIKAINDETGCQRWMHGEIIINYPPIAYSITVDEIPFPEGGSFCSPVSIGIEYSQPERKYYLYPPSDIPIILTGTGSSISFGSFETSGNYYAKAYNENTGCWTDMLGTINIYDHPEVHSLISLDDPPAYCIGDNTAITLMLSYSQTGVKYQLFKDSTPVGNEKLGDNEPIYWHQVSQYGPGNYSVRAYFINDIDCMAIMEGVVSVQELERPTASISGIVEVCESNTCTEMIVSITGSQMIEITYTDGVDFHTHILDPVIPQHPVIVCPLANTTYHLTGVSFYQSPFCDGTVSGSFTVEVMPSPTANAGNFKTTCVSIPILFDDAIAANYSNISWIHNGLGSLDDYSIQNPTYTPALADSGDTLLFIMTVSGNGACSTENVQSVVQLAIEHLPQAIAGPDMVVCITNNVDITGSMLYATNPVWSHNGNGALLNPLSLTPTYIPNPLDEGLSISFTLTVQGISTCNAQTASNEFSIIFEHQPTVDAGPGDTLCETGSLQLQGSVEHASSSLWEVESGSGTFSNSANPTSSFFPNPVTSITTMTLRLTAFGSGACYEETAQSTVEVVVYPVPTVYAGPDSIACGIEPFQITGATSVNATEFYWTSSGSGLWLNQNQLSATYYPSIADLYNSSVILTITATNLICEPESDSFELIISHLPLAYFVYETPICSGVPVFFNDNSSTVSGIIEQWHWDFGDGNDTTIYFPDSPDIAHLYSDMGQYNVTLTVTNSNGCIKSTSQELSILPAPVAAYDYTTNCMGSGTIFNDLSQPNGGGAIAYWNWNFGDPASGVNNTSTQQNPVHHFTGSGVFNVQLIITSTTGCTDTLTTAVEVSPEPSIAISASNDIICVQESIIFEGVGAPGSTWFWDFDDGFTSTEQNPSHTYLFPGAYIVIAIITNDIGCINSDTLTIFVHDIPLSAFSFDPPTCQGSPIEFVDYSFATEGYITQWEWNFGDGSPLVIVNFPNPPNVTYSYSNLGTYNVTLNVTTSLGCSHQSVQTLSIIPSPVAAFSNDIICEGLLVEFTDMSQSNGGGLISSWYWNFDDPLSGVNNNSSLQNPSHLFTQAGTYNVSLTIISFYGCSHTFSNPVTVSNSPQISFTYSNDPPCDGTEVYFTGLFEGDATSWFWQFGDGGISYVQNPIYTYQGQGTYNVILTVTGNSPEFCQFITSDNIVVNAAPIADFIYENNCIGSEVQFTDLSFGQPSAIVSWYWDFGDENFSYEQHPTNIFPEYGQYNVTLTVTDAAGCSRTVERLISIYDNPFADYGFTQLCNPFGTVQFFDLSSPGFHNYPIVQWDWTFFPGNTSNQPNPTTVFPQSDNPYDVSLVVTDSKGCSDTIIITIDVWQPLNLILQEVEPVCFGNPTFFEVIHNPTDIVIDSYTWEFMDGSQTITTLYDTISHTFAFAGVRIVKLTVLDERGCISTEYLSAMVNPLPQPDFTYVSGICNETTQFTFVNNGSAIIDYLWEFGDPDASTSVSQNPEFLYSDSGGVFEVKLTVTDINGCINYVSKQVVKNPCVQAIFMLPPDPPGICATHDACFIDLSYSLPNNGTLVHWSWDFGDGDGIYYTQFQEEICHAYISGGTYDVTLTVTAFVNDDYFDHSVTKTLVIDSLPVVSFEADAVCFGGTTTFQNNSVGVGSQIIEWYWDFGNDESSHEAQPTYCYSEPGIYPVKLIAHNAAGCRDSLTRNVIVRSLPNVGFIYEMNCVTYETIFKDISANPSCPVSSWNWDFGDSISLNITNSPNAIHTYTNVGAYTVSLEVSDCFDCTNVYEEIVDIHPVPKADFSYTDNYQNRQGQVLFFNESTGAEAYLWDFESIRTSEINPVYQFPEDGNYEIMLVSYNEFGCPDTIVKPYYLLFKGLYIPTAFVPSSTDLEVKYFQPKGVNIKEYRIEVFSQWGTMLWSSEMLDEDGSPAEYWDGTYQGADMPSGVYMWRAVAIFTDDCVWDGSSLGDKNQITNGQVVIIR